MQMKKLNPLVIALLFVITAVLFTMLTYHTSKNAGNWFSAIFLGVLGAWATVAPIIRIKYGSLPFLKIFAVLPVMMIPVMLIVKSLPSGSPFFLVVIPAFAIMSLCYLGWLHGLEFFALLKGETWRALFNQSAHSKEEPPAALEDDQEENDH